MTKAYYFTDENHSKYFLCIMPAAFSKFQESHAYDKAKDQLKQAGISGLITVTELDW